MESTGRNPCAWNPITNISASSDFPYFLTTTPNPLKFGGFVRSRDADDKLEPRSCFRRIEPALFVGVCRDDDDEEVRLRPNPPADPDANDVLCPLILNRFASSSLSARANLNIFSASDLDFSSSSRSFNSSGNPYLPLTASSASRLRFSIFFSSRKSLRTRAECEKGSAL